VESHERRSPEAISGRVDASQSDTWHAREAADIFAELRTSAQQGLSSAEAARRLAEGGANELAEAPRPTFWRMLLDQFNNFIVIILILASILSAVIGDYVEAGAIIAIVVLNAVLGVVQERRAEEALAALRRMAAPEAHVIRDGRREVVPARELVPGDIVLVEAGNYIPADLRLLESANLKIEEAALTGESVAVEKDARVTLRQDVPLGDRRNTAFMGTLVTYGRGRGVVTSTGMHTQIGMIARMLQSITEEQTPLQQRLDRLGKTLGVAALAVCGLVFGIGWLRGYPPLDVFLVAVSLAVAAVPEGLAAVVTITLALGMREMIKRHALIRRLSSVETLGSATVICSDKTGTLTQNQMTVTRLWVDGATIDVTGQGYVPEGQFRVRGEIVEISRYPAVLTALWVAVLANDASLEPPAEGDAAYRLAGDPTEGALIVAAAKAGAERDAVGLAYPRIDEVPFDSARKRMTTVHKVKDPRPDDFSPFYDSSVEGWEVVATKGAPDVILDLCTHRLRADDSSEPMSEDARRAVLAANHEMSKQALRVLAVAYRVERDVPDNPAPERVERELTFVGLIGMIDPARPEVLPAMERAKGAGIRTVMITGDYPETARAIAQDIGLLQPGHNVLSGAELARLDDEQLRQEVVRTDVFARVSPEHKVRIVDALKRNRQVVAMTGDGVNDAPALKRADIGVAMGITGTDVAKETADMVLTDDNYASIVSAVEQGRIIYSNIRKFVFYLLSCNVAEILIIFLAIMAGLPSPLTAIQLLLLNLVTDGLPALALGYEKGDPDTMDQPPRPPQEPIINRSMQVGIIVQTLAITAATLTAYWVGLQAHPEAPQFAETMAFVTLSFSELLRAFTARSERYPLLKIGLLSNPRMFYAVAGSLILLAAVVYLPPLQRIFDTVSLGPAQWELMLPLLFVPAVAAEATKWLVARRRPAVSPA
jgi:Ca2+-transporting ATPase